MRYAKWHYLAFRSIHLAFFSSRTLMSFVCQSQETLSTISTVSNASWLVGDGGPKVSHIIKVCKIVWKPKSGFAELRDNTLTFPTEDLHITFLNWYCCFLQEEGVLFIPLREMSFAYILCWMSVGRKMCDEMRGIWQIKLCCSLH